MSAADNDSAADKQAEDCAAVLMGRRDCEVCEGSGGVLVANPGHEDCCGANFEVCPACYGNGWVKA